MGCYINPRDMSKEHFLSIYGEQVKSGDVNIEEDRLPVCLVDNGVFSAAAIAFNSNELKAFKREDGRYKQWYMCKKEDLLKVSDLDCYEQK